MLLFTVVAITRVSVLAGVANKGSPVVVCGPNLNSSGTFRGGGEDLVGERLEGSSENSLCASSGLDAL